MIQRKSTFIKVEATGALKGTKSEVNISVTSQLLADPLDEVSDTAIRKEINELLMLINNEISIVPESVLVKADIEDTKNTKMEIKETQEQDRKPTNKHKSPFARGLK